MKKYILAALMVLSSTAGYTNSLTQPCTMTLGSMTINVTRIETIELHETGLLIRMSAGVFTYEGNRQHADLSMKYKEIQARMRACIKP